MLLIQKTISMLREVVKMTASTLQLRMGITDGYKKKSMIETVSLKDIDLSFKQKHLSNKKSIIESTSLKSYMKRDQ